MFSVDCDFFGYERFRHIFPIYGSNFFFSYRKQSKRTCHDVISISSESMGDYLFLSRLSNFAEENNIGLQTLARNDQEWSNFIRSFGSTSTIETSRSQVTLICIYLSKFFHFTLKVSKSRKQFMVSTIFQKKRTKLTILRIFFTHDSEFHSFLGELRKT